jgi:hypothetical protein
LIGEIRDTWKLAPALNTLINCLINQGTQLEEPFHKLGRGELQVRRLEP